MSDIGTMVSEDNDEVITFNVDGTMVSSEDGAGTYYTQGSSLFYTATDEEGVTRTFGAGKSLTETDPNVGTMAIKIKTLTWSVKGEQLTLKVEMETSVMGIMFGSKAETVYQKLTY